MEKGYYKCECGKEFNQYRKFLGHKQHCLTHLQKVNKLEKHLASEQARKNNLKKTWRKKSEEIKNAKALAEQKWLLENHTCENCGKIIKKKFGSGRFCSRACANSRKKSDKTRQKIKNTLHKTLIKKGLNVNGEFGFCEVCGKKFKFTKSNVTNNLILRKTCSDECLKKMHQNNALKLKSEGKFQGEGGLREGSVTSYKSGSYEGYICDSSWELAFVVYNLDHNIHFSRNYEGFEYTFKNKLHKYYPDFILEDGTYVEIKNYWTEQVQAKIDQFPSNLSYKILYYKDIKHMIDYCIKKYGKSYAHTLYNKI